MKSMPGQPTSTLQMSSSESGTYASPRKKFKKKCETCNTMIVLDNQDSKKRFCQLCKNERTTHGTARAWANKLWANKKIKSMIRQLEDDFD